MNIYLYKFFESEILENSYYEAIREYADKYTYKKDNAIVFDVIEDIYNEYEDWGEQSYGPYRFLDEIENFLRQAEESGKDISSYSSIVEVIEEWSKIGY